MKKIEIKNRWTNEVIYTYEAENATIKDAVLQAIKERIDLRNSNLRNSDLSNSNLSNSNLSNSNLSNSNLRNSDLSNSNLSNSDLSNSDLSNSNLSNSDLSGSDLSNSDLRNSDLSGSDLRNSNLRNSDLSNSDLSGSVKIPMYCKWTHGLTSENLIHIGCEKRTIEEWDKFFSGNETLSTERNTPEFKQIEAVYLAYKSYLTHLQS